MNLTHNYLMKSPASIVSRFKESKMISNWKIINIHFAVSKYNSQYFTITTILH